ncbi:hypothetical protein [Lactococcus lactis]|uniref:Uncharacterized protein n=1 Tax=Lactococcus lactis TaxID=1358 RepID=A0AAW5TNA3_9LACT|nr:hypothetical protein [Lactococcus lactis]MCW2280198.1 hypothetical protein [Lactococcus lactis]
MITLAIAIITLFVSLIQIFMRERILMKEEYIPSIYRLEETLKSKNTDEEMTQDNFSAPNLLVRYYAWNGNEFTRQIGLVQNVGKQRREEIRTNCSSLSDPLVDIAMQSEWNRQLGEVILSLKKIKSIYPFYVNIQSKEFVSEIDLLIDILDISQRSDFPKEKIKENIIKLKKKKLLGEKIHEMDYKTFIYSPHLAYMKSYFKKR